MTEFLASTSHENDALVQKHTDKKPLPFVNPAHRFAALNIAHTGWNPKSEKPHVRILGMFEDAAAAGRWAGSFDSELPIAGLEQDKFMVVSTTPEPSYNPIERLEEMVNNSAKDRLLQKRKMEERVQKERERSNRMRKDFEKGVSSEDTTPESHAEPLIETPVTTEDSETPKLQEDSASLEGRSLVSPWPQSRELRDQSFCCIVILEDPKYHDEPAIKILGCFRSEEDCEHYVFNTASKYITNYDIHTVRMYEWLDLSKEGRKGASVTYRHKTLDELMRNQEENSRRVQEYEFSEKMAEEEMILEKAMKEEEEQEEDEIQEGGAESKE